MDLVFVILHYIAQEETEQCVEYIKSNVDTINYHIIIVDNASPNGSGERLQNLYKNNSKITIILNSQNQGFAKGNNLGIRYAKKYFSPKYLIMLNNDVFLLERNLYKKLEIEFVNSNFYVLGPMILTGDGRCDCNPDKPFFKDVKDIDKQIKAFQKKIKEYQSVKIVVYFSKLVALFRDILSRSKSVKREKKDFIHRAENVKLHGCFLIFSCKYLQEYDGLDESTFLYCEEEFLYKHMIENKKTTIYNPDILVYHLEDAATDMCYSNQKEKAIFFCEKNIDSLKKLKELYLYYDNLKSHEER